MLRDSRTASVRKEAMARLSALILVAFDWGDKHKSSGFRERLEVLGLEPAHLNLLILEMIRASRSWTDRSQPKISIIQLLTDRFPNPLVPFVALGRRYVVATAEDWEFWITPPATDLALKGLHIHAVKGAEFEAVMLDIPLRKRPKNRTCSTIWESSTVSEALRVLYVGASRARRLLVLAVPPSRSGQIGCSRLRSRGSNQNRATNLLVAGRAQSPYLTHLGDLHAALVFTRIEFEVDWLWPAADWPMGVSLSMRNAFRSG